jgi:predicted N-acyltransferase
LSSLLLKHYIVLIFFMKKTSASRIEIKWFSSFSQIDKEQWNELALPLATPFLEWEWLFILEKSGSICRGTGWEPKHLTLWRGDRLAAAAPLYIKMHSEGEFVFDYLWAEAAFKLRIPYYPKLVGMSPATPVPGYRFLLAQGEDEQRLTALLLAEIDRFSLEHNLCGVHFLYTDQEWQKRIAGYGFTSWLHQVYEWQNQGFASFSDYLGAFKKSQRHNIKRERDKLAAQGITVIAVSGKEAPPWLFKSMYDFYADTNARYGPWGCQYLNQNFFNGLAEMYGQRILFMAAYGEEKHDQPLGLAMFLRKKDRLYGRYWGGVQGINSLHFNTCYYSPIEWAIANGISHFDPGVGSDHKVRRGFLARGNYSLHRFQNKALAYLMQSNINRLNLMEQEYIDNLNACLPFKQERIK